jgi:modulator of FtsH protease HflK
MTRLRIALVLAFLAYLATGIAQIRPEERGVVRRFGRVVARPGPGLWIGLPWGIDRVDRVAVRTARQLAIGVSAEPDDANGQYLTGDQNLVNAGFVAEFAVQETDAALDDFLANGDTVELVLGREIEALAAEWFGATTVDDALLSARAAFPRWALERLAGRLAPHRLGIAVQRVSVDVLAPPAEVRDAFEQVNRAQAAMSTRENLARQDAAARLREAAAAKFRYERQAEAYRTEREGIAKADAAAFRVRLEQYRRLKAANPAVLDAIWWDEMGRVLLGLKTRGRIDLLDHHLGKDGLDVTQFLPPKRK